MYTAVTHKVVLGRTCNFVSEIQIFNSVTCSFGTNVTVPSSSRTVQPSMYILLFSSHFKFTYSDDHVTLVCLLNLNYQKLVNFFRINF